MNDLQDLKTRFVWRDDGKVDSWALLKNPIGPLVGDCDDYALTAQWLIADKSILKMLWNILTLKTIMWNVATRSGNVHMALWVRGRGWTCNIYPEFAPLQHKKKICYILPVFLVGVIMKMFIPKLLK